jgi:hypothetical protein
VDGGSLNASGLLELLLDRSSLRVKLWSWITRGFKTLRSATSLNYYYKNTKQYVVVNAFV